MDKNINIISLFTTTCIYLWLLQYIFCYWYINKLKWYTFPFEHGVPYTACSPDFVTHPYLSSACSVSLHHSIWQISSPSCVPYAYNYKQNVVIDLIAGMSLCITTLGDRSTLHRMNAQSYTSQPSCVCDLHHRLWAATLTYYTKHCSIFWRLLLQLNFL